MLEFIKEMKIIYRPHLRRRIKERQFPVYFPRKIYNQAKIHYLDTKTNHAIAVVKLKYAGKSRNLAISYDIISENIEIITIHPISEKELKNKINTGRWKKYE